MKYNRLIQVLLWLIIPGGFVTAQAGQPVLAIRAQTVLTVSQDVIQDGIVLVRDGKIQAVGKDLAVPEGAKILDMPRSYVMPGLIDTHSHLGLASDPRTEMDEALFAVSADTQVLDAFDPGAEAFQRALRAGITCALVAPGNRNPIAGQTAVVKYCGGATTQWLLKPDAGLKFSLTLETLQRYRKPTSWPGMITLVKDHLDGAAQFEGKSFDPQASVLKRVLDKGMPVFIMANTPEEIGAAVDLIRDYQLDGRIIGAGQGDEVAQQLADQEIPVLCGPVIRFNRDRDLRRTGRLAGAGVKVAFASHAPETAVSDLRTSAIYAVKYGMDRDLALKGLTLHAAQILGVSDRVGSIEEGKDADLVILGGDPLEQTSAVQVVIVNGRILFQGEGQ